MHYMHKKPYPFSLMMFLAVLLLAGGCASRPPALPAAESQQLPWGAIDLNISNTSSEYTIKNSLGSILVQKAKAYSGRNGEVPFNILTLSGGGSRGAYGAGFVTGWSERGTMPTFDIITGISTGAIMATYVFVGGREIGKIKNFYTTMKTEDIYTDNMFNFFGEVAIKDPTPFKKLLAEEIDESLLEKVAREHAKGRRLYVGTTNLDTGRLVVWDMGAIASSHRADRLQLYRDIIYASSAIPILFPPQFFEVESKGHRYYQMHVDGGIYSYVFMIGLLVDWNKVLEHDDEANSHFDVTLYSIVNRKYRQRESYDPVDQKPAEVIRALLLTETDLLFDRSMNRLYENTVKRGFKFRMAFISADTGLTGLPYEFDPAQMQQLFETGYRDGRSDYSWQEKIAPDEYDRQ